MAQKLTIVSIQLNPELGVPPTGTFSIRENVPGAAVTIVGTNVIMSTTGVLTTPIEITGLVPGKTYRIKCVLNCGTSYAKLFTIPEVCPAVENLSVALMKTGDAFTGLKVFFTHISGYNGYVIDVYKYGVTGDPGSVFVNSYSVIAIIGETVLSDPALFDLGVTYYVRISRVCKNGNSAPSDFVQYTPTEITAIASFNPSAETTEVKPSIDLNEAVAEDVIFTVYFKLEDDTTKGPYSITVTAGQTMGEITVTITEEEGTIGADTDSLEITEVAPSQIGSNIITF